MVAKRVGCVSRKFQTERRRESRPALVVIVVDSLVGHGGVLHELVHPRLGGVSGDGRHRGDHRGKHRRRSIGLRGG